ncbi:MAG: glycosyltransferase family 29 protein [Bacteroidota bacterium]|nr:glycosyltransferase family 29 protein [Bacteroidota bacterium]
MSEYDIFKFRDKYKGVKSIAFVGNSSSVLSYENGKLIDSYDMVIRYNRAYTKGIEKNIGSKTTVLISNDINGLKKSPSPSEVLQPEFVLAFSKPKSESMLSELRQWIGDTPYLISLEPDLYNLGISKRTRSLSMGTYSLYTFLRLFDVEKIFLTGFTMFGIAPGGGEKYFERWKNKGVGKFHDIDEEAVIFNQIIKQFMGKIEMSPEVEKLVGLYNKKVKSDLKNPIYIKLLLFLSKKLLHYGFVLRRKIERSNTFNDNKSNRPKNHANL